VSAGEHAAPAAFRRARSAAGTIRSVDGAIARLAVVVVAATALTASLPRAAAIDAITPLVAAAAFCVAALTRRRAPSIAWLAAIVGSFAAAMLPIAQSRLIDPRTQGVERWELWAIASGLTAATALWIAADYATRPARRFDPVAVPAAIFLVGWFLLGVVVAVAATLAGQRTDPAFTVYDVATAPVAAFALFLAVLTGLGAGADIGAALARARSTASAAGPAPGTWSVLTATIRELTPGIAAAEAARATAERREIAGDLHASVVPSLRRAIAEAEGGADPTAVLRHLRAADLELERLMADRWPVVLETFGLVAALEDLAERLEAGGAPPIALEIERSDGRPPRDVERAAWRFAQLSLDNAVRHACAAAIEIRLAVAVDEATLAIRDDGAGFDPASPARRGARGHADLRSLAASVGADATIASRPGDGATCAFAWRAG
jgi:signal transduction histidine kinase